MLKKICDFIANHFDFKFYGVTWVALIIGLSIIPALIYMPQTWGYENGVIENIQLTVLFFMVYLCATSKINKPFFNFLILVLSILIIREVNCGRTLFFPIPGEYHKYYSWRDLPWPWLGKIVHFLYGLWIAIVSLVFLKKKFYLDMWELIRKVRFPFWNILFACFAMFMGAIAEKATNNNFVFEEGFELLFYVSLMGILWLYSRNENFQIKDND